MNAKQSLTVARITVACIAVVAAFLAWNPDSSVFRIVSFAWAGFGASFGPVMLFSLFWKRTNKQGALAGMIAGAVMVFVWKYLVAPWAAPGASTSCCPPSWWPVWLSWWSPWPLHLPLRKSRKSLTPWEPEAFDWVFLSSALYTLSAYQGAEGIFFLCLP